MAEYTHLEYIESTGKQYIDTGVSGNNDNLTISIKFNLLQFNSYCGIFGNYAAEDSNCWRLLQTSADNERLYLNANFAAKFSTSVQMAKNVINTLEVNKDTFTANGISYQYNNSTKGTDNENPILLFTQNAIHSSYVRIYSFSIFDDESGTLIRDFIPVKRKSDGALGMYDTQNDVFYGNAGTGAFIAGAEIPEPTPTDPTSMTMGWLMGIRIAGQRKKKTETA